MSTQITPHASRQVWLCPTTSKNMKVSILNRFKFENGDIEYAWAFSQSFQRKWESLEIGALCIFGNSKDGFIKAAYVSKKAILNDIENWPFRSPSGNPWTWGFYLTEPFDIDLSAQFFIDIGRRSWTTQNLLKENEAQKVLRQLGL